MKHRIFTPAERAGYFVGLLWIGYCTFVFALIGWFGFVINPLIGACIWIATALYVALPFLPFIIPNRGAK